MFLNLYSCHTRISLAGISDRHALAALIEQLAAPILEDLTDDEDCALWDYYQGIQDDLEWCDPAEHLEILTDYLESNIKEVEFKNGGASIIVGSGDSSYQETYLVDLLCEFLLPYSTEPYLLLHTVDYWSGSGQSKCEVLYIDGKRLIKEEVSRFFSRLLANPGASVGDVLPVIATTKTPVVTTEQQLITSTAA